MRDTQGSAAPVAMLRAALTKAVEWAAGYPLGGQMDRTAALEVYHIGSEALASPSGAPAPAEMELGAIAAILAGAFSIEGYRERAQYALDRGIRIQLGASGAVPPEAHCRCGATFDPETGVCNRTGILANHCDAQPTVGVFMGGGPEYCVCPGVYARSAAELTNRCTRCGGLLQHGLPAERPAPSGPRDSEHQHLRDVMVRIAQALGHDSALILEVTCKEGESPAQRIAAEVETLVARVAGRGLSEEEK